MKSAGTSRAVSPGIMIVDIGSGCGCLERVGEGEEGLPFEVVVEATLGTLLCCSITKIWLESAMLLCLDREVSGEQIRIA